MAIADCLTPFLNKLMPNCTGCLDVYDVAKCMVGAESAVSMVSCIPGLVGLGGQGDNITSGLLPFSGSGQTNSFNSTFNSPEEENLSLAMSVVSELI
ncbi:MAG TPA: hypothetical protein PKY96_11845, partial [Flavobacteriales bacterium]|nr:hypothetical protein [Flavobacteriales bacterium]